MKRKLAMILSLFFFGIGIVMAQTTQVRGKVLSTEDGQPIVGASIKVKGSTTGTTTDSNGEFKLSISGSTKTLVISYIGMKQVEVESKMTMNIKMEPETLIKDELVVTGIGAATD